MHVNPNYVVHKIAKYACEYCRHIKILKDHSMCSRFFYKIIHHETQRAQQIFFYKMSFFFFFTCQSYFLFFCRIVSYFFFSKKTRTPLGIKWDAPYVYFDFLLCFPQKDILNSHMKQRSYYTQCIIHFLLL